ncbi:hypothetical protein S7335_1233 [Synechococcus sp. PCC 7335]|uniref:hypothetical protein n=1 Tax=Synechococcus sp. (strain ATCC 29403 / PCC 7335) TaxID=91464 RepID=UPI00017EB1C4|nr:hypothetical protein [Synechococcus sp. PCC 7335]EDX82529.1 hypothetical protein S7335_1233 [Synechococcus sp. PCC 7335]
MTIHIITSGKANVGKSSFAAALATVGANAGANPSLIDADDENQTLYKLYGKGVPRIKLSDDELYEAQPDTIWYKALQTGRDVIVDLAAQTDSHINRWLDDRGILEAAKDNNIGVIKWWLADLDPDSFERLDTLCQRYRTDEITHVLVKSHFRGRPSLWAETEAENKNIITAKENGLKSIEFPKMFIGINDRLRANNQTFYEVLQDKKHENIDMLNRSSVIKWIKRCTEQIEQVYQFTPVKVETQKAEGETNATPENKTVGTKVQKPDGDKGKSKTGAPDSKKNEPVQTKAK